MRFMRMADEVDRIGDPARRGLDGHLQCACPGRGMIRGRELR